MTGRLSTKRIIRDELEEFFPGYFALVMATGIVSISAFLLDQKHLAWLLFQINKLAYAILCIITVTRLLVFPRRVIQDISDHPLAPGFLTIVAGTCILGSQFVLIAGEMAIGILLWCLGIFFWAVLIYTFMTAITIRKIKPGLAEGLNGAWLMLVVATQAVSVLGMQVTSSVGEWKEIICLLSLALYLVGGVLYFLVISLIFYRLTFFRLTPEEFAPTYWINMGAVAISTLSGATLVLNASQWVFLEEILSFLKGSTLLFWAMGSWWIPFLVIATIWRSLHGRSSLQYDPRYWGMVFPLGMYTACTYQLMKVTGIHFLSYVSHFFFYVALLAWAVIFTGLIYTIWKILVRGDPG